MRTILAGLAVVAFAVVAMTPITGRPDPQATTAPQPTTTATTYPAAAYATSVPGAPQLTTRAVVSFAPATVPAVQATIVPGPIPVPIHVMNVVYWPTIAASTLAPWVTYVYPNSDTQAAALQSAGMHPVLYVNATKPLYNPKGGGDPGYALLANGPFQDVLARDCSGNVVPFASDGLSGAVMDYRAPQAFDYLQTVIAASAAQHPHDDTLFLDNYDPDTVDAKACSFVSYALDALAVSRLFGDVVMPFAQIFANNVWPSNYATTPAGMTVATQLSAIPASTPSRTTGPTKESCLVGIPTQGKIDDLAHWVAGQNEIIATLASGRGHQCYWNGAWASQWAASVTSARIFLYASWLLTYDAWDSVVAEYYQTPTLLSSAHANVFPEMGFVALNPTSTQASVSGYADSNGVYVRSFGACSYRGMALGPCIVGVNPSTGALPFAYAAQYPYAMTLSGSDVFDADAWIGFTAATPSTIAAQTGIIALTQAAAPMGTTVPSPIPSPTVTP